jgi:TIR domain/Bacterial regulatory proteins, luxR family
MTEGVFISYSHRDKDWLQRIHIQLRPLMRNGLAIWDDRCIASGSTWSDEIDRAINRCRVALLLVSPDFLASDFIHERELAPALSRRNNGELIILWAYLRSCLYEKTIIGTLQAAHDITKPLASLRTASRELAITNICREVHEKIQSVDSALSKTESDSPKQCTVIFSGNADAHFRAKLDEWARDSSLTVIKIETGSIKLTLEGPADALEALERSFVSGKLEKSLNRIPLAFYFAGSDEHAGLESASASISDADNLSSSISYSATLKIPVDILNAFTPRQQQVIQLVLRGAATKMIAREIGISEVAVKSHLNVIYKTLEHIASGRPSNENSLLTALQKESDA